MNHRRAAVGVLHFGMCALLTITLAALLTVFICGGPGWLILPVIVVVVATLQVNNWWLPILRRLLKPGLPTVDAVE